MKYQVKTTTNSQQKLIHFISSLYAENPIYIAVRKRRTQQEDIKVIADIVF